MTEKLPDVWTTRDFPVLREVTRRFDSGSYSAEDHEVAQGSGLGLAEVRLAARALERRGFVAISGSSEEEVTFTNVAGAAYLITGLHPDGDDALSKLVATLQQAADQTTDEAERGRLRRAADALLSVGRDVMTGVLTAYLSAQMPR